MTAETLDSSTHFAAVAADNEAWLHRALTPYFFDALRDEPEAVRILSRELHTLRVNQSLILIDRPRAYLMARPNVPGSLLASLKRESGRKEAISFAMFEHSSEPIPGMEQTLEIQQFEFDCKSDASVREALSHDVPVHPEVRSAVEAAMRSDYPDFDFSELDRLLKVLWINNPSYTRLAPARRVAQTLRLLQLGVRSGGVYLDVEPRNDGTNVTRVSFAVASPPHRGFLAQLLEVLLRLGVAVQRAYVLEISTGDQPYALFTFFVTPRDGSQLAIGSPRHEQLEREFMNTGILSVHSPEYKLVTDGVMGGEDAALVNAFVTFCHTNLAHAQPDRFDWKEVRAAFHANPDLTQKLVALFRARFDPSPAAAELRKTRWTTLLADAEHAVRDYNTGHKHLDDVRRDVFRCCLAFIQYTLKTNFFVRKKSAFAFRVDPAYLAAIGAQFTEDLPKATPFRVTFFATRDGFGYHIGFSDIARGGWRTILARTEDDVRTNAATLFRENFVLAHTQHLKNKDIYEGGSKLVMLIDAAAFSKEEQDQLTIRLHKLQRCVIGAFLDVFVTDKGVAKDPAVVDYYREDEPIELGPDENMHDEMIEEIAVISRERGYILGIAVMSSKRVGINHKEYGVTSTGVVKCAEITMKELGVDLHSDAFSVKFTGGPNGDVAGNAMRILLDRCPRMKINMILDGTGALHDPEGADPAELQRILLKDDLHAFRPEALHVGGMMLFRTGTRKDGLRDQYRKVTRTAAGLQEEWISTDDFSREFGQLIFTVPADVFIPSGGRPETIDKDNWQRFLLADGTPSSRAIIEGANSFITPEARVLLQKAGVIIMRDASANKCGVISSSYEIIANLLLSEPEFLENKARYVSGVLSILERRAADETRLILERRRKTGKLYTEISDSLSYEINANYARLFQFFQARPELAGKEPFISALRSHLPEILQNEPAFRERLPRLPQKYRSAILAAEIGSSMVYQGDTEEDFADMVKLHAERHFTAKK